MKELHTCLAHKRSSALEWCHTLPAAVAVNRCLSACPHTTTRMRAAFSHPSCSHHNHTRSHKCAHAAAAAATAATTAAASAAAAVPLPPPLPAPPSPLPPPPLSPPPPLQWVYDGVAETYALDEVRG
jgi:hypothetical protein